ncbi:hypothetical protein ILYODFUR_005496 [Ilyodon furcidens]|uniref:Uncharacterized protein n=1 Tax=Ilyodon furcidens TaxID=33524 RepID=A0ABV0TU05_9TELE
MACSCIALYSTVSHPAIHRHILTLTVVTHIVASGALGRTDKSRAAIQSGPLGPLSTISRQDGWSVLLKDTITERDRATEPATYQLQDKTLPPEPPSSNIIDSSFHFIVMLYIVPVHHMKSQSNSLQFVAET